MELNVGTEKVRKAREMKNIHIIEDEDDIAELVRFNLTKEGHAVTWSSSGEEGMDWVTKNSPDLLLLDLMLPGVDGLEICRRLKQNPETDSIPIMMLTAKGEEADIVKGLEIGAEDYITKPFSPKVLSARIKTVLRRFNEDSKDKDFADDSITRVHDLVIHPGRHELLVAGEKVELTRSEFMVLEFLAGKPGWVFTRSQIVDAIRGKNYAVTDRAMDVLIVGLRKKLGQQGSYIETVRGVGYRFKE